MTDSLMLRLVLACVAVAGLASACSSGDGPGSRPPPVPPPTPPDQPQGIRVVAGDGNDSEVRNTISWTLDADITEYAVYWSNTPGVTVNSTELVPTVSGSRYVTHSGPDVVPAGAYYYRVQARSGDTISPLSAEVRAIPQAAVTGNSLNDVAWNGVDRLVAVGDSGIILASANGQTDPWTGVSTAEAPQSLSAVTWEDVNSQFLIVGAGSTVLTGDGNIWTREDLSNLPGAVNLNDVAWLDDRYIAVGNSGTILTSNVDGSLWTAQLAGAGVANTSLNAVAASDERIVVVGTNGTILESIDAVTWNELPKPNNNDLNDIVWDFSQFTVVGSNDTILTSPDGLTWTSHVPGTSDINFVAVGYSGPIRIGTEPVLAAVGSAGTYVIDPDNDPGTIVRTGTTEQLGGIAPVFDIDGGLGPYFVFVGNDGTVLTTPL